MDMKKSSTKKPTDLNQLAKSIADDATKDKKDKKKRPDLNELAKSIADKTTKKQK